MIITNDYSKHEDLILDLPDFLFDPENILICNIRMFPDGSLYNYSLIFRVQSELFNLSSISFTFSKIPFFFNLAENKDFFIFKNEGKNRIENISFSFDSFTFINIKMMDKNQLNIFYYYNESSKCFFLKNIKKRDPSGLFFPVISLTSGKSISQTIFLSEDFPLNVRKSDEKRMSKAELVWFRMLNSDFSLFLKKEFTGNHPLFNGKFSKETEEVIKKYILEGYSIKLYPTDSCDGNKFFFVKKGKPRIFFTAFIYNPDFCPPYRNYNFKDIDKNYLKNLLISLNQEKLYVELFLDERL